MVSNPEIAVELSIINSYPIAKWFNSDNLNELEIYKNSKDVNCLNLIVLNNLEKSTNIEEYKTFISNFKDIGNSLFVLEPNSIFKIISGEKNLKNEIIHVLNYLKNVYIELSYWLISSDQYKNDLINLFNNFINLSGFKGIVLNTSNYRNSNEMVFLCNIFNSYFSRKIECLIDTSRNYIETPNEWCNSKNAGIGEPPDILNNKIWVKQPGLSDGICENSNLIAGFFDKDLFINLYNNGWFVNNKLKKISNDIQQHTKNPIETSISSLPLDNTTSAPQISSSLSQEYILEGGGSFDLNGVKLSENYIFMESKNQPRIYKTKNGRYEKFNLNDKTLEYVVDISNVKCGFNFAVYFVEMNLNAKPGTGYCDAQMDVGGCVEMDITESNSISNHLTSHPCYPDGKCDKFGNVAKLNFPPDINFKSLKFSTFFNKKEGKIMQNLYHDDKFIKTLELSNDLSGIFNSFENGMVLVISLWTDPITKMSWLNGNCDNYNQNDNITASISDIRIL